MRAIYVAGPYTGDEEQNTRNAIKVGHALMDLGLAPYIPHLSHFMQTHGKERPYEDWMSIDFAWVRRCDALLRLPGASNGADREVDLAESLGIPVLWDWHDVTRWVQGGK